MKKRSPRCKLGIALRVFTTYLSGIFCSRCRLNQLLRKLAPLASPGNVPHPKTTPKPGTMYSRTVQQYRANTPSVVHPRSMNGRSTSILTPGPAPGHALPSDHCPVGGHDQPFPRAQKVAKPPPHRPTGADDPQSAKIAPFWTEPGPLQPE